MPLLRGLFRFELPESILIEYNDGTAILKHRANVFDSLCWEIGDFTAQLKIAEIGDTAKSINGEDTWIREVSTIEITISRHEEDELPIIKPDENGRIDLNPLQKYLERPRTEYMRIASEIIVKLLLYFRYEAGHPIVNVVPSFAQTEFQNPKWFSEDGELIWNKVTHFSSNPGLSLKLFPDCGVVPIESLTQENLRAFLNSPSRPALFEEILADARVAIAESNTRRAILEMAIACEVGTKHVIAESDSYKATIMDKLKSSKLMNLRNIDYIDKIPSILYGRSIRNDDKDSYLAIKRLYQCRNSVAHEGNPEYKDDRGRPQTIDKKMLTDMWNAINAVINLLNLYAQGE